MNKKLTLLIILFAFPVILSIFIFSNIANSNSKLLPSNLTSNEKHDSSKDFKTSSNKIISKENLIGEKNDSSEYKSNNISTKDNLVQENINTNENKFNTSDSKNKANTSVNITTNSENKNTCNVIKKQNINIQNYLNKLPCITYQLKQGETLTDIARRYESTCNLNTTVKMIKSINKIKNENDIDAKTVLSIPESTIKNGVMYKVVSGDTWYKVAEQYYPKYDVDSIMNLIVYVNNLPNNDLPLGKRIFLPII